MSALLSVRQLSVAGPRGELVHPLDLEVQAGQTLVILGESGSGKTLSARALCGLLPEGLLAAGEMSLDGVEVDLADSSNGVGALRGRGITLLLQDPFTSLSPTHRCGHPDRLGRRRRTGRPRLTRAGIAR